MYFSASALLVGALAAGQAYAASISHEGFAGKRHNHAARHAEAMKAHSARHNVEQRDTQLINAADTALLTKLGAQIGSNLVSKFGLMPWIGKDGDFTNEFINTSGEDLILTIWGPAGSWINAIKPQVTISIAKNCSSTVSFPVGWSGAWAPVYKNSEMKNGQVFETWGEGTFAPPHSVVDVSREVKMTGRNMKIVGPKCTSDMDTCVFKCKDKSVAQCTYDYELVNCDPAVQAGAYYGFYYGAASGGCGGMGDKANIKTYLG